MQTVNITTAKSHLSSLLKKLEKRNDEIIIERAGIPIARIIKYRPYKNSNRLGCFKGKITVAKDFNELPSDIALSLGLED